MLSAPYRAGGSATRRLSRLRHILSARFFVYVVALTGGTLRSDIVRAASGDEVTLEYPGGDTGSGLLGRQLRETSLPRTTRQDVKHRGYVAMCLMVKDPKQEDIREWLAYHLSLGIDHAYIYDDSSATPVAGHIADFIAAGQATVSRISPEDWKGVERPLTAVDVAAAAAEGRSNAQPQTWQNAQVFVYEHCFAEHRRRYTWLTFIDADEFIVLLDDLSSRQHSLGEQPQPHLYPSLQAFLSDYEDYAVLAINQRLFGTSGHEARPKGGVMANYIKCVPEELLGKERGWYKSIVNTWYSGATEFDNPHFPTVCNLTIEGVARPYTCVDADKRQVLTWRTQAPAANDKIVLNHYAIKSLEDYEEKKARGGGAGGIRDNGFIWNVDRAATAECWELASWAHPGVPAASASAAAHPQLTAAAAAAAAVATGGTVPQLHTAPPAELHEREGPGGTAGPGGGGRRAQQRMHRRDQAHGHPSEGGPGHEEGAPMQSKEEAAPAHHSDKAAVHHTQEPAVHGSEDAPVHHQEEAPVHPSEEAAVHRSEEAPAHDKEQAPVPPVHHSEGVPLQSAN